MVTNLKDQTLKDFEDARIEYETQQRYLHKFGFDIDVAIISAEYYGSMIAFAQIYLEVFGDSSLLDRISDMKIKLYKVDYGY